MIDLRHVALAAIVAAAVLSCGPSDPTAKILEERSRWEVQLLSWAERQDGSLALSTRVTGPPRTSLRQLTFRVVFQDAAGEPIGDVWKTIELSEIQRGGPKDLSYVLPPNDAPVEQMQIDAMEDPTPEQAAKIPELAAQG